MTDVLTQEPMRVFAAEGEWPYLMVPLTQLEDVRRILDEHKVQYSASENAISMNGQPPTVFVDFRRGSDAAALQAILDGVK